MNTADLERVVREASKPKRLRNNSTPEAREIWRRVDRAADRAPEYLKALHAARADLEAVVQQTTGDGWCKSDTTDPDYCTFHHNKACGFRPTPRDLKVARAVKLAVLRGVLDIVRHDRDCTMLNGSWDCSYRCIVDEIEAQIKALEGE